MRLLRLVVFAAVASAALLVGNTAAFAQTAASPTFNKDIAPILYANCTSCHRPGEIGPMSLLSYKEARPWAKSIATRVANGTMPPWHADPAYQHFANERRLTESQKTAIAQWAAAGAPEGNAADLPKAPEYKEGWNMEPDVILSMQEDYPIPASGTVPYEYFEVPANFKEDRWITAWEIRPGDRRAVHHIIVQFKAPAATVAQMMLAPRPAPAPGTPRPAPLFVMDPQTQIPDGQEGSRNQHRPQSPTDRPRPAGAGAPLGGYVPGTAVAYFPEGTALKLPAGYSIVFQMHYTPYGKETTDRTKIGLKFAKEAPKTVLNVAAMLNAGFKIPAGASNYEVDQSMVINRDVLIYSFVPHTHVRGTGWYYEATYPDGKKEVLLSVPKYDFNWQHEYVFKEPLKIPAGTRIAAKAWYNNSPTNKSNPDPNKDVTWGDQTWEEMMYTSITFSIVAAPTPTAAAKGQQ